MQIESSSECPTYFRACVFESQRAREGYVRAGYHLGIHLGQLVEPDVLDLLAAADADDHVAAVWAWFGIALPR